MSRRRLRVDTLAVALATALIAGCAPRVGIVVLLPESDAKETNVVVRSNETRLVLDRPYAAADVTTAGVSAYASNPAEVQALFGQALAAQPDRPVRFTLYFVDATDALTEASQQALETAVAAIAQRPVPDIVVVGHTDLVGTDAFNDVLARKRADAVRAALVGRGIAPESIDAVGRGKRQPAIATADGVAEPRNRRVEIIVR